MCDTMSLAFGQLAVAAIGSIADYSAKNEQADAQEEYNQRLQKNAEEAYKNDIQALRLQQQQDEDVTEEEIFKNSVAARKARARAKTSAGEAGVTGLSVDALLADFERQEASFNDSVRANLTNRNQQRQSEEQSALTRYKSRLNSQTSIARPSLLNTGLNIADQGLQIKHDLDSYQHKDRN